MSMKSLTASFFGSVIAPIFAFAITLLAAWHGAAAAPVPHAGPPAAPVVVVVVQRAAWCPVCKAHGARVATLLMRDAAAGRVALVVHDVTDARSLAASAPALAAVGLAGAVGEAAPTGVLYLFDARTKRPLGQIAVARADGEIEAALVAAAGRAMAPAPAMR